jgi:hypothetical protein
MSYIDDAERSLETEWKINGGMAKIFTILRDDLDEGSDEPDAWELIWIDGGGVRRHETFIDCAYGRFDGLDEDDYALLKSCPDQDVVESLMEYINCNN